MCERVITRISVYNWTLYIVRLKTDVGFTSYGGLSVTKMWPCSFTGKCRTYFIQPVWIRLLLTAPQWSTHTCCVPSYSVIRQTDSIEITTHRETLSLFALLEPILLRLDRVIQFQLDQAERVLGISLKPSVFKPGSYRGFIVNLRVRVNNSLVFIPHKPLPIYVLHCLWRRLQLWESTTMHQRETQWSHDQILQMSKRLCRKVYSVRLWQQSTDVGYSLAKMKWWFEHKCGFEDRSVRR